MVVSTGRGARMKVSNSEFEELSQIIGLIYETVLDERKWPVVMESICRHVRGRASRIYWRDASNGKGETVYSWGFDPHFLNMYRETYVSLNPLFPASVFIKPGEVFSSRDLIPNEEFESSRFFREWAAPQGFLDAAIFNIQRYQASAAAFTILTGSDYGLVDDRMRHRLSLLAPHLQRAAIIRRELDRGAEQAHSLEAALDEVDGGVFLLDALGRTVWTNRTAGSVLARGDLVRNASACLSLVPQSADRLLREGLAATPEHPEYILHPRPALIRLTDREGGEWVACLMRLRRDSATQQAFDHVARSAVAALFVRRVERVPEWSVESSARFYGLTPAEVRVLHAALGIDTVAEMANAIGVSPNTVKKHLSAIFAKMGVTRRAGLIKAVMSVGP
jgi:DNA-binding CsgD family transcriptional regulator